MIGIERQRAWSLAIAIMLVLAAGSQSVHAQDEEAEENPQLALRRNQTRRAENQFDQWVYGNAGLEAAARRQLEANLEKDVDQFDRVCAMLDSQRTKLLAAGRGDIKRYFDRVADARRRILESPNVGNLNLEVVREAEPLARERMAILAGDGTLLNKAIRHNLDELQMGRYKQAIEDRKVFRHRAAVRWTVILLARSLGLTDDQRGRFESLLLAETRPPRNFGVADYQIVMYQAAMIPEGKLKPIFDDLQWRILSKELAVARDHERWLKNGGLMPDAMIGD